MPNYTSNHPGGLMRLREHYDTWPSVSKRFSYLTNLRSAHVLLKVWYMLSMRLPNVPDVGTRLIL
jgi:hypothetical protein